MRLTPSSWFFSLLLCLMLVMGCAWKAHVARGDEYMAAQDYDAAAQEYAAALELKPGQAEIRQKLERAQAGQIEARAAAAMNKLEAGDDLGAIQLTVEAFSIMPEHPKTKSLIQEVVAATTERAKAQAAKSEFAPAMATYEAIVVGLPTVRGAVEADMLAVAQAWAAQLAPLADAAEAAGKPATALLYREKIVSLTANGGDQRTALRQRVSDEVRYTVKVKAKASDPGASTVVEAVRGAMGSALVDLSSDAKSGNATLTLAIGKPKFKTDKSSRKETVQYQSGTKQVENPFYKQAQDDVLDEERRLVDAEAEVTRQQEYVAKYEQDVAREGDTPNTTTGAEQNLTNAQSRLTAARRKVDDQRQQVLRAKEKAADTAPTTEEPVYSDHVYTITTHTLTGVATVRGEIKHSDARPPVAISTPLQVSASDDEHPEQPVANVPANPLTLPSQGELTAKLFADAVPVLQQAVATSFAGYREQLLAQVDSAPADDAKLEAMVRYVLSDPASVDPAVVTKIFAASGIPDAGVLLQRGGGS